MYDEHKSWYSFIVTTLVGFVYAWGFMMMVLSMVSGADIRYLRYTSTIAFDQSHTCHDVPWSTNVLSLFKGC